MPLTGNHCKILTWTIYAPKRLKVYYSAPKESTRQARRVSAASRTRYANLAIRVF